MDLALEVLDARHWGALELYLSPWNDLENRRVGFTSQRRRGRHEPPADASPGGQGRVRRRFQSSTPSRRENQISNSVGPL